MTSGTQLSFYMNGSYEFEHKGLLAEKRGNVISLRSEHLDKLDTGQKG